MKYKIILHLLAVFLLLGFSKPIQSQGVGLSGKRFSVFYNLDYRGTLIPYVLGKRGFYYNEVESEKLVHIKSIINFRHTLQVEYSLLRHLSVGLVGSYFRDGFGVVEPDLFSKNYNSFSYGANVKWFRLSKGAIGPLGSYISLKIFNTYNKVHFKGNSKKFGEDYIINETSTEFYGFSLTWGKQGILTKKVLYNLGMEFGFLINVDINNNEPADLSQFRGELGRSLFSNHLLRLTFGVGICPF